MTEAYETGKIIGAALSTLIFVLIGYALARGIFGKKKPKKENEADKQDAINRFK